MIKKDKKLFITLILMLIIFTAIILVVCIYEKKSDEYENLISAKEKYLTSIKTSNEELEKENKELNEKIKSLNEEKETLSLSEDSDLTTYYQSMIDLSDISLMIKEGKTQEAKEELLKINPSGFDLTALSFYESLCRELNIEN